MKFSYAFLIISFVVFSQPLFAQLTPAQAVAEMGRGINLGNTLEPPLEGGWNNGPAQEVHFDAYVEAGFSNVRIPVRWDQHTGNSEPFAVNENWMNRVEQVVDWGLERGFYITLNGHHEDWLKNNYANETLRNRYDAIWVQIAERFKDKSEKLIFEIINEPKGMTRTQVDELNARILGIIRQNNPTRLVIYGGNEWANSAQLLAAAIPDDDYVIGYYHSYDPWNFSGLGNGTWGTANDYQQMNNQYQSVKNWSEANGIPVHHSEFGALLRCDYNSRMRIYAHNVEQCLINGFAFSVWDDGGDFGVLKRNSNTWPEVKDILMHYHEDSPNQITSSFVADSLTNAPTIVLNWNNRTTNGGGIFLEKSVNNAVSFTEIARLPANATTFTDSNVESGKTYTYRIYTTRADGTLLHGYPTRLRITATEQTPFNASPISIPGKLEVEEYDNGGEGMAYHDTDPTNIPGGFRTDEGVDIGEFGDGYILEYVSEGEWIEYTVDVAQAGIYSVSAEVGSAVANGAFSVTFNKNNAIAKFNTPNTGNWYTFQTITANNEIELEAGVQIMRLDITNNNSFNADYLTFNLESATNLADLAAIEAGFTIAPNPSTGVVNIELTEQLKSSATLLRLFNVTGKQVGTFSVVGSSTTLDLNSYPSGLYLLELVGSDVNLIQRVVIR
ncbi:MAG: cellulase family glycosylhydrolase [Saprospiraceae bacterium]